MQDVALNSVWENHWEKRILASGSDTESKKPGRPQAPRLKTGNWKLTAYLMNNISR